MLEDKSSGTVMQGFVRPGPGNCPKCGWFIAHQDDHHGACLSCVNWDWAKAWPLEIGIPGSPTRRRSGKPRDTGPVWICRSLQRLLGSFQPPGAG